MTAKDFAITSEEDIMSPELGLSFIGKKILQRVMKDIGK